MKTVFLFLLGTKYVPLSPHGQLTALLTPETLEWSRGRDQHDPQEAVPRRLHQERLRNSLFVDGLRGNRRRHARTSPPTCLPTAASDSIMTHREQVFGYLADRIGRKFGMIAATLIVAVSVPASKSLTVGELMRE